METVLREVTNWSIVYDSYHRPIVKNDVKNILLLDLKIEQDKAIVNNKLILTKNTCEDFNNKYSDLLVKQLEKWLNSK